MTLFELTSVIGLFVGPVLAAAWTVYAQERQRRLISQQGLVTSFLAVHDDASDPNFSLIVRRIPLDFAKDKKVVVAWGEWKKNLATVLTPESPQAQFNERERLRFILMREMTRAVGWKFHESDIQNLTYISQGLVERRNFENELQAGLLPSLNRIAEAIESHSDSTDTQEGQ